MSKVLYVQNKNRKGIYGMKIVVHIELEELQDFVEGSNVEAWLDTECYIEGGKLFSSFKPKKLYTVSVDSEEIMVVRESGKVMIEGSNCRERRLREGNI